ncbi:SDR family oxidoreductase [Actinomyces culturomici]|uniref:SDR family oxidoreductase n=1 Tax=Actinomyces culturomici TaxID=1926276 RepID=UPI000E202B33|nr:SDR family oxidoreductase [Actinomyces culturomici]
MSALETPRAAGASPVLGITGSTGRIGGRVARLLADAGATQVLLARTPSRAPALPGATVRACSYEDTPASREALSGLDALFMVSASESAERLAQHLAFVEAARAVGVPRIVYLSFQGASPDATFTLARTHAATEEAIRASGMTWTFLRDSFYLDFFADLVGEDGVIRGPAGNGRCGAVAIDDVARVAAAVLLDLDAYEGRTLDLTGPEALTMDEVAAVISRVEGREVSFHDETVEEAYEFRKRWPAPQWQYDAWVSTYTAIRNGELALVTRDVEEATGRAPLGLEDVLRNRRA